MRSDLMSSETLLCLKLLIEIPPILADLAELPENCLFIEKYVVSTRLSPTSFLCYSVWTDCKNWNYSLSFQTVCYKSYVTLSAPPTFPGDSLFGGSCGWKLPSYETCSGRFCYGVMVNLKMLRLGTCAGVVQGRLSFYDWLTDYEYECKQFCLSLWLKEWLKFCLLQTVFFYLLSLMTCNYF